MKRKNKNLAAVAMAATMACAAHAKGGEVIGDWQTTSPLITNNPNNVGQVSGGTGESNGWFDWQASNGGNGDTNSADTITYNNPGSQPGNYFPPPYYTYPTAPAPVAIGTQALQAEVYQTGFYQNLSLKMQYEVDGEGNNEMSDFFNNTEFTIQVTYNATQWQSTAGIQNGLSINAQSYGFEGQPTNYANNGFGPPNYDTGNPSNPGNWDASDYASTATGGITTRTMTFYYGNILPGGVGNAASNGTTTIPANASYVELIMATNAYSTNGTLGDIYFSNAQFTNTVVNTSWQALQHAQGTSYNWGNNLNFAPFNESTLTGGMPCNAGDTVTFGNDIPTGITETIDLNANQDFQISVGTMIFDNTNSSYLIDQGSGGTLTLNGNIYSPSTNTTTAGGSTIAVAGGSHAISAPIAFATNTTVSVTNGSVLTLSGKISGTGSLAVGASTYTNGTGSAVLSGANTYSGGTTISLGTLVAGDTASSLTASSTGTGAVSLNGGVLASAPGVHSYVLGAVVGGNTASETIAPGGAGAVGSLSIGGLTSTTFTNLNFDLGSGVGPEITNGDLLTLGSGTTSIAAGTLMSFTGTTVSGDDYRLIGDTSAGTVVDAITLTNFTLPAAGGGLAYSLSNSVDPGFIDLVVSSAGPVSLTWNNAGGATPSDGRTWDIGNNKNWNGGASNVAYTDGSGVTFNDTNNNGSNPNAYNVTLNTLVSPSSVTVSTTGTYSITGTGTIGGTGSLTKSGTGTLSLATPNAYSGGTIVTAGKLLIGQAGTNATFSGPTLVSANTLTALPTGALSVSGSGIAQLADGVTNQTFVTPGVHSAVVTSNINLSSLSLTGSGTLDIGNNRIIIDYGATDPIASIKQWIANGFSDGETAGALPAIISSDVASDDAASGFSYGLGYADGADGAIAGLPSGEIEIMFTLLGDANLDGTVNSEDFTPFSNNLNGSNRSWDQGDFNYDGTVNSEDFTPFSHDLNQSDSLAASEGGALASPLVSAGGLSLANVPEPTSVGLMAVAGMGILRRRRRASR